MIFARSIFLMFLVMSPVYAQHFGLENRGYGVATYLNQTPIFYWQPPSSLSLQKDEKVYILRSNEKKPHPKKIFEFQDNLGTFFQLVRLDHAERDAEAFHHHDKGCGHLELLQELPHRLVRTAESFYDVSVERPFLKKTLDDVQYKNMLEHIEGLEAFESRFHTSEGGLKTPLWIRDVVQKIDVDQRFEIRLFDHVETKQQSVVVRLKGLTDPEDTVVLGSHLDSVNRKGTFAPGADDDASGVAALLEMMRVVVDNKMSFHKSVEWHFYAAEEIGLVGSAEVAKEYADASKKIAAMVQLDMIAWVPDQAVFLIETDTDTQLTNDLGSLMDTYQLGSYQKATLSAGTSDHRSWSNHGYPVAFPFENPTDFNPGWHSPQDTSSQFQNPHMSRVYAQLSLATLGHYAGVVARPQVAQNGDAYFAIQSHQLFVSLPLTVDFAFLCQASLSTEECQAGVVSLEKSAKNSKNRQVFSTQEVKIAPGQGWFVWGETTEGVVQAFRGIQVTQKN